MEKLYEYLIFQPVHKIYHVKAISEIEARIKIENNEVIATEEEEEGIEGLSLVVEQVREVETCIHGHDQEEVKCPECGGCISCVDEGTLIGCGTCRKIA